MCFMWILAFKKILSVSGWWLKRLFNGLVFPDREPSVFNIFQGWPEFCGQFRLSFFYIYFCNVFKLNHFLLFLYIVIFNLFFSTYQAFARYIRICFYGSMHCIFLSTLALTSILLTYFSEYIMFIAFKSLIWF